MRVSFDGQHRCLLPLIEDFANRAAPKLCYYCGVSMGVPNQPNHHVVASEHHWIVLTATDTFAPGLREGEHIIASPHVASTLAPIWLSSPQGHCLEKPRYRSALISVRQRIESQSCFFTGDEKNDQSPGSRLVKFCVLCPAWSLFSWNR
jgi:hypothetical protein